MNTATEIPDDLRAAVVAFICMEISRAHPDVSSLSENTDITTELNLDSVAIMELIFSIEEKFDISISLNDLADTYKIGQIADLVCRVKTEAK